MTNAPAGAGDPLIPSPQQAEALGVEGNRLREAGAFDDAVARFTEALAAWRCLGRPAEAATALVGLAWTHHQAGRDEAALAILAEARSAYADLGLPVAEAATLIRVGDIRLAAGEAGAAAAAYQEARGLARAANDTPAQADALAHLAAASWELGDAERAVSLQREAAELHQAAGDLAAEAAAWVQVASGLAMVGRADEAEATLGQALMLYQAAGGAAGAALVETRLARLLWRQGRRADAEQALTRAIDVLEAAGVAQIDTGETVALLEQQRARVRAGLFPEATRGTILPAVEVEALIQNTVAVLTVAPEQRAAWRERMDRARTDATRRGGAWQVEVDLFEAVLALVDGATPTLAADHPYAPALAAIRTGVAAGGPKELPAAREIVEAVRAFVGTEDWAAARRMVEERHEVLFRDEVDALFDRNIATAMANGDERGVRLLALHRDVLRTCREQGIEAGFQWLQTMLAEADARAAAAAEQEALPPEFVPRCVAALLGTPAERVKLYSYLQGLGRFDPQVRPLTDALGAAALAGTVTGYGTNLTGPHAQVWRRIAAEVARGDTLAPPGEAD
jgi:tetratricopeptide (TPR) repeat protein